MFSYWDQWIFSFQEDRGTFIFILMGFTALLSLRLLWSGLKHPQLSYKIPLLSISFLMSFNIYLMTLPKFGILPIFLTISFMMAATSLFIKKIKIKLILQATSLLGIGIFCTCLLTGISLNISYGPSMWPNSGRYYNWILTDIGSPFEQGDRVKLHIPPREKTSLEETWRPGSYHKRVLAKPGDLIHLHNDYIQVNHTIVMDCRDTKILLTRGRWLCPTQFKQGKQKGWMVWGDPSLWALGQGQSFLLSDQQLFLIGDNAPESTDSRDQGPADTGWILGKIITEDHAAQIKSRWMSEQEIQ